MGAPVLTEFAAIHYMRTAPDLLCLNDCRNFVFSSTDWHYLLITYNLAYFSLPPKRIESRMAGGSIRVEELRCHKITTPLNLFLLYFAS